MNDIQKIQHLYLRAGFGMSPATYRQMQGKSLSYAIKQLFRHLKAIKIEVPKMELPDGTMLKKASKKEKQALRKKNKELKRVLNSNWVETMISSKSSPLLEKMTLFWHGHFACESKNLNRAAEQLNTLRKHALGNFKDFLLAISKDSSMILYLNNQQNRKNKPNENYARELMELFTIGRGNYSEQDVKEAARAFTGWFTDRSSTQFRFVERQHDFGQKTFMGKTGNFNGEDIIDIILERKETALFIARKIYRFFVNEIKENNKHIEELATVFRASNYDIKKMMQHLFQADWFYAPQHLGAKIKSPIEFVVHIAKLLDLKKENEKSWLFTQIAMGQQLFKPPNVAGWPGGAAWIDNSTLLLRLNFAGLVFQRADLGFRLKDEPEADRRGGPVKRLALSGSMRGLFDVFAKSKALELGPLMSDYLIQVPVNLSNPKFRALLSKTQTQEEKIQAWTLILMSLPEFQLC